MPEEYGNSCLCKICSMKILSPTWKNKEYSTNEEIEKQKEIVMKNAAENGFPTKVINDLADFFTSKKVEGLVKNFDGHSGQKMAVCDSYCIINTTGKFDYKEIEKAYLKLMIPEERGQKPSADMLDGLKTTQKAVDIIGDVVGDILPVKGSLKRQIVKTGKSFALKAISEQLSGGTKAMRGVQWGERLVDYGEYQIVKFVEPVGKEAYGFIRLQKSEYEEDSEEDILFFFSSDEDIKNEAKVLYEFIRKRVKVIKEESEISNRAPSSQMGSVQSASQQHGEAPEAAVETVSLSVADEILKFKQLLDMGAITQEEYDAKKKQLLDL